MDYNRPGKWVALDDVRRKLALKHEYKRRLLKLLVQNSHVPPIYKYNASFRISLLPILASPNKVRNRCVISGRNYNVLRKTQYCRFVFRHNAYFSNLPGVRRSS